MSRVIYAITDAPTADTALRDARKAAFDRLVGATADGFNRFDYYHTFNEDNSRLPTKSDGSEFPTAVRLNSTEGQELLADGWNTTKEDFAHDLSQVQEALSEFNEEAIMEMSEFNEKTIMESTSRIRNQLMRLSEYVGPSIRLYTQYGCGIRTPDDFALACADLHQPWIVPANIHL